MATRVRSMEERIKGAEENPVLLGKLVAAIENGRAISADTVAFYVRTVIGMGKVYTGDGRTVTQKHIARKIARGF